MIRSELIAAIALQPLIGLTVNSPGLPYESWEAMSDPVEYVGMIPEPASLALWGLGGLLGLAAYARRRRK